MPTAAMAAAPVGGVCSGPVVSAQDQYCENVPSATGPPNHGSSGQSLDPRSPGRPSLAKRLPRAVVRELSSGRPGTPRRRLLTLPGAPSVQLPGPATASSSSLPLLLILVVAAIVLASMVEAERRRRRRRQHVAT